MGDILDAILPGELARVTIPQGSPWYEARNCGCKVINSHTTFPGTTDPGGGLCIGGQGGPTPGTDVNWIGLFNAGWRTVILGQLSSNYPTLDQHSHCIYISRQPGVVGCYGGPPFPVPANPACDPVIRPGRYPQATPRGVPRWQPWVDPLTGTPVDQIAPFPEPPPYWVIPHRRPNPWRPPQETYTPGNREPLPPVAPLPPEVPYWEPPVVPATPDQPALPTIETPPGTEVVVTTSPDTGTVVSPRQQPRPGRPGRGVKENKVRVGKKAAVIFFLNFVVSNMTEFFDLVNALYRALPNPYKPGYYQIHYREKATGALRTYWKRRWMADFNQKLAALRRSWDKVDLHLAREYMMNNAVIDRVAASTSNRLTKSYRDNPTVRDNYIGYEAGGGLQGGFPVYDRAETERRREEFRQNAWKRRAAQAERDQRRRERVNWYARPPWER